MRFMRSPENDQALNCFAAPMAMSKKTTKQEVEDMRGVVDRINHKLGGGNGYHSIIDLPWSRLIIVALVTVLFGGGMAAVGIFTFADNFVERKMTHVKEDIQDLEAANKGQDLAIVNNQINSARLEQKVDNILEGVEELKAYHRGK